MHVLSLPRAVAVALLAGAAALAGCGGSGGGSSGAAAKSTATPAATATTAAASSSGGGQTLSLAASEQGGLSFTKKALTARAGTVTLRMANPSGDQFPHAIAIEGKGVDKDGRVVQPGSDSTVTAHLQPGTYTFYCPVPGHRQAGMEGTLTIQ